MPAMQQKLQRRPALAEARGMPGLLAAFLAAWPWPPSWLFLAAWGGVSGEGTGEARFRSEFSWAGWRDERMRAWITWITRGVTTS